MRIFHYLFWMLCTTFVAAQSVSHNYNLTISPKVPTTITAIESLGFVPTAENSLINILYRDGFGRSTQQISKGASPLGNDIVKLFFYDQFNRETRQYYPYPAPQSTGAYVSNPITAQASYYQSKFSDITPFSDNILDHSPIGDLLETSGGGDVWQAIQGPDNGKTTKYNHVLNAPSEIKNITLDPVRILNNNSYYPSYTLTKTVIKNENWIASDGQLNTKEFYANKDGQKIAEIEYYKDGTAVKKIQRQFVYDKRGLLRYKLSPEAATYDFQGYNSPTSLVWDYKTFLNNPNASGSGNVTATINSNNTLTVTFNATFSASALKLGRIVYIDDKIPNMSPGVITCPGCGTDYSNGYLAIVIDGYLHIESSNPVLTTGFSSTRTYNIPNGPSAFISNQQVLDKYAHQYNYDEYNRIIERKDPGRGWEYIVYDQLDRPILTQDANLSLQGMWLFTKYDAFGRVLYTGLYASSLSRANLQAAANSYILNNTNNQSNIEKRQAPLIFLIGNVPLAYTNNAFPVSNSILTINYYDDYNFQDNLMPPVPSIIEGQTVTYETKGLLTASYTKNLTGTAKWTRNYSYYDVNGRSIFNYQYNVLGGYTQVITKYDFRGKVEKNITRHKRLSEASVPELVIIDRYTYDRTERLTGQYQKINTQAEETIAIIQYDDLGTMARKSVGGKTAAGVALQHLNYKYNIRNWLTEINSISSLGNSLFAYKINYTDLVASPTGAPTIVPQYNGNIAQIQWATKSDQANTNGYLYYYDELNRFKNAYFTGSNNGQNIGDRYSESITYDINGNIQTINRNGPATGVTTQIDRMTYSYDGNQLTKIEDLYDTYGFSDGTTSNSSLNDYQYDLNGNLIKDRNKGIETIVYNHLDLVQSIYFTDGQAIQYLYDAAGNKISKTFTPSGGTTVMTEYFGEFQYVDAQLQYFPTAEGFVSRGLNGTNEVFTYVYTYRDHLGNARLNYKGDVSLLVQEPFTTGTGGFTATGTGSAITNSNGKLNVAVTNSLSGAQKLIISNVEAGTRINITADIDKATTGIIRVLATLQYASGLSSQITLSQDANGAFSTEIVAPSELSNVYVRFVKSSLSQDVGISTYFLIDNLTVKRVNLQVLSSTNYYPYGMIHAGEIISGEASTYNYKFQGKEFQGEANFGCYDFGSRLYEPVVGRWLSPDPQNQFDSPYTGLANNPVLGVDPDGEEVISAIVAGAIIGAFFGASTYAMNAMMTENWDWADFGKSTLRGAVFGAISGGLSGTVLTAQGVGESIASGVFSAMVPGKTVNISDNISFNIAPSLMSGNASGIGVNVSAQVKSGNFSLAGGYGFATYSDYNGFASGTESRLSGLAGWDDGKTGLSLGTNLWGGNMGGDSPDGGFGQRTGVIGLHSGDFRAMYENDGGLGIKTLRLGDRGDSYRTAALNISIGDYTAGFNLFTGRRNLADDQKYEKKYMKIDGEFPVVDRVDKYGRTFKRDYVYETGRKYRIGVLSVGYRGYRVGVNSEHVRHAIQDEVIHGMIHDAGFENQSWDWKPYFQVRTPNIFSSWQ